MDRNPKYLIAVISLSAAFIWSASQLLAGLVDSWVTGSSETITTRGGAIRDTGLSPIFGITVYPNILAD